MTGVLGIATVIVMTVGVGSAAHAASVDEVSVRVPSTASSVWIDVDTDSDVRAQLRTGAVWRDITLGRTVFGVGAVVPAAEGVLRARVVGSAATDPDLSLTVVDETGTIVASATSRVVAVAVDTEPNEPDGSEQPPTGAVPDGLDPDTGSVDPGGQTAERSDADEVSSGPQRGIDGALAFTGTSISAAVAVLAALSMAIGLLIRRRQAARR